MEKPAHNRVVIFSLFATAPLATGLRSLGPVGGFPDSSTPHFIKLACLRCGEETSKDVGLYSLESGVLSCTDAFGARNVRKRCHPTCPNPAHLVRKCKSCHSLGSVELLGVGDAILSGERLQVMRIACLGYKPLVYTPGPGWVSTNTAGELLRLSYGGDGKFATYDQPAGTNLSVSGIEFQLVEDSDDAAGLVYPDAEAPGV